MKRSLLYLIGVPGAGKSTLAQALFAGLPAVQRPGEVSFVEYPGGVQLGALKAGKRGTDSLHLCAQPAVLAWMEACPYPYVFAEGDRLAYGGFFQRCVQAGYDVTVSALVCPGDVADARRNERGHNQTPVWVKGRTTKFERLRQTWADPAWELDATLPLAALVERLRQHPVIKGIRREQVWV